MQIQNLARDQLLFSVIQADLAPGRHNARYPEG